MSWRDDRDIIAAALAGARESTNGSVRVNCPLCPSRAGRVDQKRSLTANLITGYYQCYRCAVWGRLEGYASSDEKGAPRAQSYKCGSETPQVALPDGYTELFTEPGLTALSFDAARDFLRARGVGPELWRAARLGACQSGDASGRIVAPVFADDERTLVGWSARAWVRGARVPYLNAPGPWRSSCLYNASALYVQTDAPVLVVEGVFDALAYWPDAVALLGKPTGAQLSLLAASKRPIAVVLDGDAWVEGDAIAYRLRLRGVTAGAVRLPACVDPDEVDHSALREAAQACLEV